ncbi:MAG: hypothetical protein ACD_33C00005G0014 [uncultured bacterium]|nr:MAG: hypothetical protein ACD_33C00005G0014 [uncultured bacterium]
MNKLTLFNLSGKLETNDHILANHIRDFLDKYYTVRTRSFNNKQMDEKVYASKIASENTYYFHINQLKHFYYYLKTINYTLKLDERIDNRDYKIEKCFFKIREGWVPRDYQEPIIDFILTPNLDSKELTGSKLVPIATGRGKAQPLDAKIKVPGGWSTMGAMQVDTIITAKDGSPTKVTGVYPQGKMPVYKITFIDGRTCEASDEHLWKVFIKDEKKENRKYQIVNTLRLKELTERNILVSYLDLIDPEILSNINLPINPYLLGALLGDGGFTLGSIKITKYDKEFIDKIKTLIPDSMELVTYDDIRWKIVNKVKGLNKSFLITELRKLGLLGKYSYEKFIPNEYLFSSTEQKIELLQGLLDTDGSINKNGSIIYGTSSYFLAKAVQYLIRSIGGLANISSSIPYYTKNGIKCQGKLAYKIGIRYKYPEKLFTLTRKLDRLKGYTKRANNLKLRIESVEYIGEKETQCISIDHPDKLYITDNFIVTHNTSVSLFALAKIQQRIGIVILPIFIDQWIKSIATVHETTTDKVMVIQGSKALRLLIQLAKEDSLESPYIIFSSRTLQDFVTAYESNPELTEEMYGIRPIELFPLLGIGVLLNDESHAHFHALFKILLHTNVKFQIGLSATLISDNWIIKKMHNIMYPKNSIYETTETNRYTDIYAISYTISPNNLRHIKTNNYGSNMYSHTAYEKSIMRRDHMLVSYYKLITNTIDDYFIEEYLANDKLLIFVATVELASNLVKHLTLRYPKFNVKRYCEDDPYDNLHNSDIIVSTVISAGTAVDIKDLRVCIQTISISSSVSNLQSLGRLRKLSDRDVKFCYLYAGNLNKQKEYHIKRVELFKDKSNKIIYRSSSVGL